MSRSWTRRGLTATSPGHYSAMHRLLFRQPRRRDALDCERGEAPEEWAEPVEPEPWWEDRLSRILAGAARSEREALAWRAPSHVEAGRAIGRSKERARQIRRQVAWIVATEIERAIERATPADRLVCGWSVYRSIGRNEEWARQRYRISRAVEVYASEAIRG